MFKILKCLQRFLSVIIVLDHPSQHFVKEIERKERKGRDTCLFLVLESSDQFQAFHSYKIQNSLQLGQLQLGWKMLDIQGGLLTC